MLKRLFLSAAFSSVAMSATATAADNVHYSGRLVTEPCTLAPESESIAVEFGSVVDKYLYQNSRTLGQTFTLRLMDCNLELGNALKITFSGSENAALPGLLAIDGASQAKGIAIGLETPEAKPVPINQQSEKYLLQEGSNVITLGAYVQGEPQAIANKAIGRGAFSAIATFNLEYQ
ncbi:fimbrial protein [Serratia sp. IR-2025]|uniref:fimbrial protein n=1 Tax=Serratia marcescens TaxID=615 RepID=UPI003879A40E